MNGALLDDRLVRCLDTSLLIAEIRDLANSLEDGRLLALEDFHEVEDLAGHRAGRALTKSHSFGGINVNQIWGESSTQLYLKQIVDWQISSAKLVESDKTLYDTIFNNKMPHKKKIIKKKEVDDQKTFDPSNTDEVEEEIKRQRDKFYEDKGYVVKEKQSVKKFKKIWKTMIKKELGKCARQRAAIRKEKILIFKKAAKECSRVCRQKAVVSQKCAKDALIRGRRLAREISMCWRQLEKEEKTSKRKADRLLSEQKRKSLEVLEARKQQRKLNYLITQTELYTHFMSRKMSTANYSEMDDKAWSILDRIEEEYDEKAEPTFDKEKALKSVKEAVDLQMIQVQNFASVKEPVNDVPVGETSTLFHGELKSYQKKGVDWLLYLFEQGINGILADEMGLGKTIQTIAFLAILAEKYDLWGPFLIVAPASTVHNWTQEFNKFLPSFRVVPYWGNVGERKILRRFWNNGSTQNLRPSAEDEFGILQSDSSFHVVVSSYQVVLQDAKMVGRVRWQYLVLDEAHAIKNTSSQRWNTLLSFECRNRLLLTGTPIQNTMQELWALLHFIMPTLFDSHEEFNDWFSRDIESQATAAVHASGTSLITTKLNTTQLSRLHLILQPFMLRRVKAEVEHELPDKIEISLQCHLSTRQRAMYHRLKRRIRIDDLSIDFLQQKSLLNLVMQLRKVCNHPDLVEPRVECFSVCKRFLPPYVLWPRLLISMCPFYKQNYVTKRLFNIHHPNHTHHSIYNDDKSPFSFLPLFDISLVDYFSYTNKNILSDLLMSRNDRLSAIAEGRHVRNTLYTNTTFYVVNKLNLVLKSDHGLLLRQGLVLPVVAEPVRLGVSAATFNIFQSALSSTYLNPPVTVELVSSITRIADSAKLAVLDRLLTQLKMSGHRVLIYSQMTRMIDIIEDLMYLRDHRFIRLDGSSRLSDRRDMVADFQSDDEIFAFLLSTRAGGLGINLTAADTVVFFDSDWNPTVDQQAMDRAHRLGQSRQVTVYRLVCRDTVEEKILFRAEEKREMHRMVIAGADLCPEQMKARDVASLLLEDEEMNVRLEQRRRQSQGGRGGSPPRIATPSGVQSQSGTLQVVSFTESALQKKRRKAWAGVMKSGTRPKKIKLQEATSNSTGTTPLTPSQPQRRVAGTTPVTEVPDKSTV